LNKVNASIKNDKYSCTSFIYNTYLKSHYTINCATQKHIVNLLNFKSSEKLEVGL